MFTEFDRLAMTRALALAERGLETTHPNPRVGCVIAKGDRIIGEGFHERAGEPHAEVMALRSAKEPVAGATAYVTLEPCSHHGRTPPCVNALIEARIARVVFAVQDPNPRVSGQGADALLRAGITVEAGLLQNEATELNIGFMKRMKEGLPWVRVKLAMSLDGRTALANGASQWITGEAARADVQRWRARCSAVMTGVGTVLADDPQLNVRLPGFKGRQPLRVVLDARLRSPVGAKLFAGLGVGAAGAGGALGAGGAAKAAAVGAAAGVLAGDVVIFTTADGGLSAVAASARGAAAVDASKLAELVNAFETSPTSVVARHDNVAGPVSVKSDTAAPPANWSVRTPAAEAVTTAVSPPVPTATDVPPPIVAAAADAAGVSPHSDDATWSGAALSGSIPVKPETEAESPPTDAPLSEAAVRARAALLATATIGDTVMISTPATPPKPAVAAPSASAVPAPVTASAAPTPPPTLTGAPAPSTTAASSAQASPAATAPLAASAPPADAVPPNGAPKAAIPSGAVPGAQTAKAVGKADSMSAFQARKAALVGRGVRVEEVPADEGFLDLFAVLKKLGDMEVNEVLVEAGPTLAGQLLTTFFVDELLLYVAPKLLGPQGRPLVNLPELQSLQDAWGFSLFDAKRFGDDLRLRMRPK